MVLSSEKGLCGYEEGQEQSRCNPTVQVASFDIYEVMRSLHILRLPDDARTSILNNTMLSLLTLNKRPNNPPRPRNPQYRCRTSALTFTLPT